MAERLVAEGGVAGLEAVTAFNRPVFQDYGEIVATVRQRLGDQAAGLFARPVLAGDRISWFTDRPGEIRRWLDPAPADRAALEPARAALDGQLAGLVSEFRRQRHQHARRQSCPRARGGIGGAWARASLSRRWPAGSRFLGIPRRGPARPVAVADAAAGAAGRAAAFATAAPQVVAVVPRARRAVVARAAAAGGPAAGDRATARAAGRRETRACASSARATDWSRSQSPCRRRPSRRRSRSKSPCRHRPRRRRSRSQSPSRRSFPPLGARTAAAAAAAARRPDLPQQRWDAHDLSMLKGCWLLLGTRCPCISGPSRGSCAPRNSASMKVGARPDIAGVGIPDRGGHVHRFDRRDLRPTERACRAEAHNDLR